MNDSVKAFIDWLSNDATKAWIVALATAIGAILTSVMKLKWAEEYKKVVEAKMALIEKNAELSAKLAKEQIDFAENKFKAFTEDIPGKMRDLQI